MRSKCALSKILALALVSLAVPHVSVAQEGEQATLYVAVDCMKSTAADYQDVETQIWQPMHQEMVNRGKKNSWAFFWVLYGDRSDCDYYTVNTYRGEEQLNDEMPFSEVFEAVHPGKNSEDALARTAASREMVRSQLWTLTDAVAVPPQDFQYVVVNQMLAEDVSDAVAMEREVYKPVHQALVDGGHWAGWGLYELVAPSGTSMPYNYSTADFLNKLGPVPYVETMRTVHPDREVAAIGQEIGQLRDFVRREIWVRLAGTQ